MMRLAEFLGNVARPFAIIATSFAASVSCIIVAVKAENGNDGATAMWAIGALVAGVYGFKAWEERGAAKSQAEVRIAEVAGEK